MEKLNIELDEEEERFYILELNAEFELDDISSPGLGKISNSSTRLF